MKKRISFIIALLMIISALAFPISADFENTYINTGDKAIDIIEVARTQLGYMEGSLEGTVQGSNDCTKYGEWYGLNNNPWCAMFVSWCANEAQIPTTVIPKHASCDVGMNWFLNNGRWNYSKAYGGEYTPVPSDIVYFGFKGSSGFDSTHVGIIYKVDNKNIYVIEGNSSAKVQTVSYSLESAYVLGYASPDYTSDGKLSYEPGEYVITASVLNVREAPTTATGTAVIDQLLENSRVTVTEVQNEKWGKIQIDGRTGWISLAYANRIFNVTYDANGGTGAPEAQEKVQNKKLTITDKIPAYEGYEFLGWAASADAESAEYQPGDNFYLNCDTSLYAVWKYVGRSFTLSFDANGGNNPPEDLTVPEGENALIPDHLPVRDSHLFLGWAASADTQEAEYHPGDTLVLDAELTLYAVWMENDYSITVNADQGGSFERIENSDGSVTLKITADKDYCISHIEIDGVEQVVISDLTDFSYIFSDGLAHSVSVDFAYNVVHWENPFTDISEGKWYYDAVEYCYMNRLMSGTHETLFSPKTCVNRAMFVTILSKIDKADVSHYLTQSFGDITEGKWYANAVEWAYNKGYTSGIGADSSGKPLFAPSREVTRQELATFLYNYSVMKGYSSNGRADLSAYNDKDNISSWASDAVSWAVDAGLLSGTSLVTLSPKDSATRAEIAVIVMNYAENIVK
ncbi:MAG: InlB B-repeat-containing protein [Clostridia bacterium]|nr:InlB B-repeat-containing protein [Clostridia bacterium]